MEYLVHDGHAGPELAVSGVKLPPLVFLTPSSVCTLTEPSVLVVVNVVGGLILVVLLVNFPVLPAVKT